MEFQKRFSRNKWFGVVWLLMAGNVVVSATAKLAFTCHRWAKWPARKRHFHPTSRCWLNRFLFDATEVVLPPDDNSNNKLNAPPPKVILPKDDYRTIHAAKILGIENGDTIRAGIVSCNEHNGLWTDHAKIEWIPEGKVKKAKVLKNGDPPGPLLIQLYNLTPPTPTMNMSSDNQILVSLILALPRPLQLGRILPMISQMGVDQLVLTSAQKVPKDYFGSHLFRKPEILRDRLIEGLCQAGDVRLPKLHIVRNLPSFLEQEMDNLFPIDTHARVIAHPRRTRTDFDRTNNGGGGDTDDDFLSNEPLRIIDIKFPTTSPPRVVVAVGPEGGWGEPDELKLFQNHGFQQITLGTRTLRSDCAVVSLLSLAHEVCYGRKRIC